MKKIYNISLNVTVDVKKAEGGNRVAWFSFKGWKNGVINKKNRFIDTEPIVKRTDDNMKDIGSVRTETP